jgi:hypothetical protein
MKNIKIYLFHKRPNFDESGFCEEGEKLSLIKWDSIVRVALILVVNKVALDEYYYWAFQTQDQDYTFWVRYRKNDFSSEIIRRYGDPGEPKEHEWHGVDDTIFSYTIWPPSELGKGMYVGIKRSYWERLCPLKINMTYSELTR